MVWVGDSGPAGAVAAGDEPRILEQPDIGVRMGVALDEHRGILARLGRWDEAFADLQRAIDVDEHSEIADAARQRRNEIAFSGQAWMHKPHTSHAAALVAKAHGVVKFGTRRGRNLVDIVPGEGA